MAIIGIIAEYNPFHTGHQHQITQSREILGKSSAVVVAMSGNWTQQASCASFDKWTRAHLAILGGADLVLDLPTPYAMSSAESFARGGVDLLAATGLVSHLSFGSEGGDIASLQRVAAALDSPDLTALLRHQLDGGLPFPLARQRAVGDLLGDDAALLATPNNTLGIEYLRAINRRHLPITPITIPRRGGAHNSVPTADDRPEFTSATDLRQHLTADDWGYLAHYLPEGGLALLQNNPSRTKLAHCERAILAKIRSMTAEDWASLPDSGEAEGLPQRLERTAKSATSVAEFWDGVKTKRYAHSRLRRLVLSAFLGISAVDRPEQPPYLRVLAFNDRGRALLKEMKGTATVPIITKPAQCDGLTCEGRALFALECRATDLFTLCWDTVPPAGMEYTKSAIYVRNSNE